MGTDQPSLNLLPGVWATFLVSVPHNCLRAYFKMERPHLTTDVGWASRATPESYISVSLPGIRDVKPSGS